MTRALEGFLIFVWYLVCAVVGLFVLALVGIGTALSWLREPSPFPFDVET